MYKDPVYMRANNWVLSTSAIFSKHFQPYGWGEVCFSPYLPSRALLTSHILGRSSQKASA